MPHSLVFNFVPETPIYPEYATGRHLHALFLSAVDAVDTQLASHLHEAKTAKAFTLSPLQVARTRSNRPANVPPVLRCLHHKPIPPGTPCWWRVSLLDDNLFGKLTQLWLDLNPEKPWHLGAADLHVTSILGTPQSTQPWANACSYAELYEEASEEERRISLQLATPVAFRQQKYDTALPTPESVFRSLFNSWKQHSGIELPEFSTETVFPCYFEIHTEIVDLNFRNKGRASKFIGAVGQIDFRIFGDLSVTQIKALNTLADYAMYSGIGRKTPMGMGITRRVYPQK